MVNFSRHVVLGTLKGVVTIYIQVGIVVTSSFAFVRRRCSWVNIMS